MFQPHHAVLIAIKINHLCRKFVFLMFSYTCKCGTTDKEEDPGIYQNHQSGLDAKMTKVTNLLSLIWVFFVFHFLLKVKTHALMCNVKIWSCRTTFAQVGRCGQIHIQHLYVCAVRVAAHVCLEASVLSCPSPQAEEPRLACHFSVWQLRARQRNEKGKKTEGRKWAGRAWIWGRWKEKREMGKEVDIQKGLARSLDNPLDSLFSFSFGTRCSRSEGARLERIKKKILYSCFTPHLHLRGWEAGSGQRQGVR